LLQKFIQAVKHASNGLVTFYTTERNGKIQLVVFIIACSLGLFFKINKYEWLALLISSSAVLAAEMINRAIEDICNYIQPNKHEAIKIIKDVMAGAVLLLAIFAVVIGAIIFYPYLIQLIK
jgi:diacylglycerol kinase